MINKLMIEKRNIIEFKRVTFNYYEVNNTRMTGKVFIKINKVCA